MAFASISKPQTKKSAPAKRLSKRQPAKFGQRVNGFDVGFQPLSLPIQTKLKIGEPNDKYEQEADRVADQVMRMPESQVQRQFEPIHAGNLIQRMAYEEEEMMQTKPTVGMIQRMCSGCEDEEKLQRMEMKEEEGALQTKSENGQVSNVTPSIQNGISRLRQSGGAALPDSTRAFMEPRFGHDFTNIKIHTDSQAAELSQSVNARAFTVGRDVFFNQGEFKPHTSSGMQLLAHELTHTVQQSSGTVRRKGEDVSGSQAVFDFAQRIVNGEFNESLEINGALAAEDFTNLQLRELKERVLDLQTTSDPRIEDALKAIDNVLEGRTNLDKVEFEPTPCELGESASVNSNTWVSNERLTGIAEGTEAPLKKGDQGKAVKLVQQALLQWGCEYSDESVNLLPRYRDDGDFGREMKLGVKEFQERNGLSKDGIVGTNTLFSIQEKVVLQAALEKEAAAQAEEEAALAELERLRAENTAYEENEKRINDLIVELRNFARQYRDSNPIYVAWSVADKIQGYGGEIITEALFRLSIEDKEDYDTILFEGKLLSELLTRGVKVEIREPPKGGDFIDGFVNVQKELESKKAIKGPDFGIFDPLLIFGGFQIGIAEGGIKGAVDTGKFVIGLFGSEFWNQMYDAITVLAPKIATKESFRYQLGGMAAELLYKQLTELNASSPFNYGRKLGVLFGQLVFEVAIGILTAGAGAALKAGKLGAMLAKYPRLIKFARTVASNALVSGGVRIASILAKNISVLAKRVSNLAARARYALPDLSSAAKAERAVTELILDEKLQKALRKAEEAAAKAERFAAKAGDDVDTISKAADNAVKAEKELAQMLDEYMAKTGRGVSDEAFEVMEKGKNIDNVADLPKNILKEEFDFVSKATPEEVSIKAHGREYDLEVDLPNDHTYRREKDKGTWCRFSIPDPGLENCNLDVDELGIHTIDDRPLPEISPGVRQTQRGNLRTRMRNGFDGFELPTWTTIKPSNWDAHHLVPWEFLDHGVFDILRAKKGFSWDHNAMKNGIALPNKRGIPGAENLPIHQATKSTTRGHPVYNSKVKQRLDAMLERFELDPSSLQREVDKLLFDLRGEMEIGKWAGVPQF